MTCTQAASEQHDLDEDAKHMPVAAEKQRDLTPEPFTVFHCNWKALEAFMYCTTQWRFRPTGHLLALDYTAVKSVIEMLGTPPRKQADLFRRVRLIEAGALKAIHAKSA